MSELRGDTSSAPYPQFEMCKYADSDSISCKYRDAAGRCVFENCVYDGLPKTGLLHYFECVICKEIDCIDTREMKVHFCHTCIERMQAAEVLPVTCKACGESIESPTDWIFSGLCQSCLNNLYDLIKP